MMNHAKSRLPCRASTIGRSYSSCSSGACTSIASCGAESTNNQNCENLGPPYARRNVAPYLKQSSVTSASYNDNDCCSDNNEDEPYDDHRPFDGEPNEIEVEDVDDYVDTLDDDGEQNGAVTENGAAGDSVRLIGDSLRAFAFNDYDGDDADLVDGNGDGDVIFRTSFDVKQVEFPATFSFTLPLQRSCDDNAGVGAEKGSKCLAFRQNGVKSYDFDVREVNSAIRRQQFSVTDAGQTFDSTFEMTLPLKFNESRSYHDEMSPQPTKLTFKRKPERNVERYYKICTLGVGTFGRVTLVRLKSTRQYYALKTMSIRSVVKFSQVDHVHSERRILESLDHPFIAKLYWAYKDDRFLYMLFDYMPGGELFSYIRVKKRFKDDTARFYAAEILLALEYLHSKRIVYRDLKPENLLLDSQGHVILIDFGFSKVLNDRTWTMCGTAEYLAPEIILGTGHNRAVDFWAFGVLIYEMLVGRPPFRGETTYHTYQKILAGRLKFPQRFCPFAKKLIRHLLVVDRAKRLGSSRAHSHDIRNQAWFANIDWVALYSRSVQPPIVPRIHCEGDSGNFDEYDETNDIFHNTEPAEPWESDLFEDW